MKKLIAMLLVLAALCCGAAFAEAAVDYTGYWVMTGAEVAGVRVAPSWLGLNAYMELYEDGRVIRIPRGEH